MLFFLLLLLLFPQIQKLELDKEALRKQLFQSLKTADEGIQRFQKLEEDKQRTEKQLLVAAEQASQNYSKLLHEKEILQ